MELSDLIRTLRSNWLPALLAFVMVTIVAFAAAVLPDDQYAATTSILARPAGDDDGFTAIQTVEFLMPALEAQAESPRTVEFAAPGLADDLGGASGSVSAVVDPRSGILRITVEATDQSLVAPAADAIAQSVIEDNPAPEIMLLTVLDPAREPGAPSGPARRPVLAGGLVLAAIVAVFTAVGIAAFRRRLDRAEEIRSRFGTDVLAEIPAYGRFRKHPRSALEAFRGVTNSAYTEAMVKLRSNVEMALLGREVSSIAVTSAESGEGKSTIATGLALGLAAVGHKTMLVDGDLRKPKLHLLMLERRTPGLSDAVVCDINEIVRPTNESGLTFVAAGYPDRHPAEVIPTALGRLLDETAASSDPKTMSVVDSPPLGGAAETRLIASRCGTVILVVDARRRTPADIERAIEELKSSGAELLGVVLNWVRRPDRGTRTYHQFVTRPSRRLEMYTHTSEPVPQRPVPRSATSEPPETL